MENMAVRIATVIVHLWDLRIATPSSITMPINTEKYQSYSWKICHANINGIQC